MSHRIALAQLTAIELPPPAFLRVAAENGCASAGLRLIPVLPGGAAYPLMDDPALLRETLRVMADTGIRVGDVEIVMLRPDTDLATFQPFLEAAGRLGARHVLVAGYDPDEARMIDRYAAFCDLAAPFGLTADLEFMPWSNVPDMVTARRIALAAGRPNAGVLLDTLHFDRSGGAIADIAATPPGLLHYWQVCDGPAERPDTIEGLLYTARSERMFPGEGGIDLLPIARAMPPGLTVSMEIPTVELARTVPATERVRRAVAATRALLDRASQAA
ncbi:MAG: sugar phosphate isomerase/epimerase family protein [Janthinobacterium lividum]